MISYSELNAAIMGTFAEPVTLIRQAGNIVVQAVLDMESPGERIGSATYTSDYYTLELLQADVDAYSIAQRDTISVRGVSYQVLELMVDVAGMATLKIRRY
jgi:hypothetical protein